MKRNISIITNTLTSPITLMPIHRFSAVIATNPIPWLIQQSKPVKSQNQLIINTCRAYSSSATFVPSETS